MISTQAYVTQTLISSQKARFSGLGLGQSPLPSVKTICGFRCQVSGVSKK
ncbi:hypothetical protein D1AOALGA4SA_6995 [Olavius algarvensis Delta 1 endosymbiont]|nr:hypothetical protein D1AOALGA4SA_6995 [Olavius algarvensis Delta 1 endosymbiont]